MDVQIGLRLGIKFNNKMGIILIPIFVKIYSNLTAIIQPQKMVKLAVNI